MAARQPKNLAVRKGKWLYIGARGSGGFNGSKPQHHAWGGPAAVALAGGKNSDMENGKLKKDAPPAQLYDLKRDVSPTTNVFHDHPDIVKEMRAMLNNWQPKEKDKKKNTQTSR